jgi:hypothetical protein
MRLADNNEVLVMLCSQVFSLRPTLRAAFCLNGKYGGFNKLAKAIEEGSITAYMDIIKAGCTDPAALQAFLKPFHDPDALQSPLAISIYANRAELLEFILILAGVSTDPEQKQEPSEPITFDEYFERLFKIGTGFLWWSPSDTWEATPAEILIAYEARQDMLKSLFGKRDDTETIERTDGKLEPDRKSQINALGDLSVTSMRGVR